MDTNQIIYDFFREVGIPSAGYRLIDFLRTEGLVLTPAGPPTEMVDLGANATPADVERFIRQHNGKKP